MPTDPSAYDENVWKPTHPLPKERTPKALAAWCNREVIEAVTEYIDEGGFFILGSKVEFLAASPMDQTRKLGSFLDAIDATIELSTLAHKSGRYASGPDRTSLLETRATLVEAIRRLVVALRGRPRPLPEDLSSNTTAPIGAAQ